MSLALHMAPAAPTGAAACSSPCRATPLSRSRPSAHTLRPAKVVLAAKRDEAGDDGGMRDVLSDPEIVLALQNPKVMQAMMELQMRGGAAMSKYGDDPELIALLMKVQVNCMNIVS